MKQNKRHYKGKDVEMLMVTSILIETAQTHKEELVAERSSWADPFLPQLKSRIESAIKTNLGVDSAKQLRQATRTLLGTQTQALKDLAKAKVQLTEDFKKDPARRTEILKQLGFTSYHKDAQQKDQEALINLLYRFNENLTAPLRAEIEAKGTSKTLLSSIIAHADTLSASNVTQETFKGSRKEITAATLAIFNGIYDDVISVGKIAAKLFIEQPAIKTQFSYSAVLKALNRKPGNGGDTPPTPLP